MIFGYDIAGKHFIANIATKPTTDSGIETVNRDPRKWRLKPDAYVGVVEETGPRCELVKTGDIATIERWDYLQLDVDDERLLCHEDHVLLVNGHPVNGVIVMELVKPKITKLGIILPETSVEKEQRYCPSFHGVVLKSSVNNVREGNHIWVKKSKADQWRLGEDKIVFRWDEPHKNEMSNILAIGEKEIEFNVV